MKLNRTQERFRSELLLCVKTSDALIHNICTFERSDRYGKTMCRISFTQDPDHAGLIRAVAYQTLIAVSTQDPATCLGCIGADRDENNV